MCECVQAQHTLTCRRTSLMGRGAEQSHDPVTRHEKVSADRHTRAEHALADVHGGFH